MKSITIPEGITRIGFVTFKGCRSLTTIIIPNGVTRIEGDAFMDCSGLASVTIPNTVTNIEDGAFYNCRSLTDVYCYAPEPPSVSTTDFEGSWDGYPFDQNYIKEHTTLHVPASSLEKYKTALRWSDFWKIVPITGTSVYNIPFNGKSNYFDLQGRLLPDKPSKGIYIENRHKRMIKN